MYQDFKNRWNEGRVDYDHVYAYQCVDLIEEYCHELGVNGVYGNAIDYANKPSPAFAQNFHRVTGGLPGDIVVLYGLPGNPFGHIGIFDHQDTAGIWMLEQNAMGDGTGLGRSAIGVYRAIPLSRVAAIYRKNDNMPPIPAPVPARSSVFLPADNQYWHLYRVGSGLRPNTSDVIATLSPAYYGGLSYKIEAYVGDYALVITTQMFGRGTIWIKGTNAQIT